MQAEEAIEVEHILTWNTDARPHRVVRTLSVWHHNVQAVSGAALKDHDQKLGPLARFNRAQCSPGQETWNRGGPHHSQGAMTKKTRRVIDMDNLSSSISSSS